MLRVVHLSAGTYIDFVALPCGNPDCCMQELSDAHDCAA
jgi:hypothetical protein